MEKREILKYFLFLTIVLLVLGITAYLVWSTISTNQTSVTGGPVHWHADFEIWNCGNKVDLIDPKGLSNKIGTPILHEHNDNRIHVEGPVIEYKDISLGEFFKVIGGRMTASSLVAPTNNGVVSLESGVICNGLPGELQVFVYQTSGSNFHQKKLADPASHILSPHPQVPPGDCIIIELDKPKEKTNKLCNFYQVSVEKGELIEKLDSSLRSE